VLGGLACKCDAVPPHLRFSESMMFSITILARVAAFGVLCVLPACVVYRYMPPQGETSPELRRYADSLSTVREAEMAALLTGSAQRRPRLTWNPILAKVARERAWDMATRGYFSHVNPDGVGPNTLVERAGYRLPAAYDHGLAGNNIESAAEGYASAAAAWRHWMASGRHRAHLLGTGANFDRQTEFGIGYAMRPGSRFVSYWVVLIAEPAPAVSSGR
jgi:uncharacterized protein YkwD